MKRMCGAIVCLMLVALVAAENVVLEGPGLSNPIPLSEEAARMKELHPEIVHGRQEPVETSADVLLSDAATLEAGAVIHEQAAVNVGDVGKALGRPLGMEDGSILDSQLTASSVYGGNWGYYGPVGARLRKNINYNGWLAGNPRPGEWIQADLGRITPVGAVATQGCNTVHWVRVYEMQFSDDGQNFTPYADKAGAGPKQFNGNFDMDTVVTNTLQRPFMARYVRIVAQDMANSWPCMRFELYADPNEKWTGGQPLGLSAGTVADDAFKASSAHGNNWFYYGPQHARLYGGGPWGGWIPQFNNPGEWIQIDLGSEKEIGAVATQGRRDGSYWVQSYFVVHSRDGNVWKSYAEGGLRRLFDGNVDHYNVVKHVFAEPFIARYFRLIVNTFPGWPTLRMELYAPEDRALRLGKPVGISTGKISDSALTASSAYGNNWSYYGPRNARLYGGNEYGAWIPNWNRQGEWVQVDLGEPVEIGGIATQGRKWGVYWWKSYTMAYSLDGNSWQAYMTKGQTRLFPANMDGNTLVAHVLTVPFVARYVRLTVADFEGWPCVRFELYYQHESRMNQGKLEDLGDPMGVASRKILDTQMSASSFYANAEEYSPKHGRLNSDTGAGCWAAAANNAEQWLAVETDGTMEFGGIATQGRNAKSQVTPGFRQWVTSYLVQYSDDGKTWTNVKTQDGADQYFRGNSDSENVVQNAFAKPVKAKWIRINPQGWFGHISMRMEIYNTAAFRAKQLAEIEAAKKAEAEAAAKAKKELEEKLAREQAEREKREEEEKAAKEKAEEDRKAAEHAAKLAQNDAERKAAAEKLAAADIEIAKAKLDLENLQKAGEEAEKSHSASLDAFSARVRAANAQLEQEKFDDNLYAVVQKKIAIIEQEIADEQTKQQRATVEWGAREQEFEEGKKQLEELDKEKQLVESEIAKEYAKYEDEQKQRVAEMNGGAAASSSNSSSASASSDAAASAAASVASSSASAPSAADASVTVKKNSAIEI